MVTAQVCKFPSKPQKTPKALPKPAAARSFETTNGKVVVLTDASESLEAARLALLLAVQQIDRELNAWRYSIVATCKGRRTHITATDLLLKDARKTLSDFEEREQDGWKYEAIPVAPNASSFAEFPYRLTSWREHCRAAKAEDGKAAKR